MHRDVCAHAPNTWIPAVAERQIVRTASTTSEVYAVADWMDAQLAIPVTNVSLSEDARSVAFSGSNTRECLGVEATACSSRNMFEFPKCVSVATRRCNRLQPSRPHQWHSLNKKTETYQQRTLMTLTTRSPINLVHDHVQRRPLHLEETRGPTKLILDVLHSDLIFSAMRNSNCGSTRGCRVRAPRPQEGLHGQRLCDMISLQPQRMKWMRGYTARFVWDPDASMFNVPPQRRDAESEEMFRASKRC